MRNTWASFRRFLLATRSSLTSFPNPFNPHTTLRYELARAGVVDVAVHDVRGRLVRNLVAGEHAAAGVHELAWDGRHEGGRPAASGVYHVTLRAADRVEQTRLVLVR